MHLRKYIDQMFEVTGLDELQMEVHVDQHGNVNDLSPHVVRFNVKRDTADKVFNSLTPPHVSPERIAQEANREGKPKRYRSLK